MRQYEIGMIILILSIFALPGCLLLSPDQIDDSVEDSYQYRGSFSTHIVGPISENAIFLSNSSIVAFHGSQGLAVVYLENSTFEMLVSNTTVLEITGIDRLGIIAVISSLNEGTVVAGGHIGDFPGISTYHANEISNNIRIENNGSTIVSQRGNIVDTLALEVDTQADLRPVSTNQSECESRVISQRDSEIEVSNHENLSIGVFGPFSTIRSSAVGVDCDWILINTGDYIHLWSTNIGSEIVGEDRPEFDVDSSEVDAQGENVTETSADSPTQVADTPIYESNEPFNLRIGPLALGAYDLLSLSISVLLLSAFVYGRRTGKSRMQELMVLINTTDPEGLSSIEKRIEFLTMIRFLSGFQVARLAEMMNSRKEIGESKSESE